MASDKEKEEKTRPNIEADSSGDSDNWALRQMYVNTKNLVRSTDNLKCWTIAILVATVLLLIAAIIQIVSSCQLSNAIGALNQ